jgi:molybdenum cofactor biosynthesis enzyme MoaA
MRIQTLSIITGSEACNARCPYCISKMTPPQGVTLKEPEVNWRNFRKAAQLAKINNVSTVLLTGKGEPALFPHQITKYLDAIKEFEFPLIELQTNGTLLTEKRYEAHLKDWYERGMTTIAISIVHYEPEKNREIFLPHKKEYINLTGLIEKLHDQGFSVRLAGVLADGYISDSKSLENLISFAKENNVEQLTVRPVNKPEENRNNGVYEWTRKHQLKKEQLEDITDYLAREGKPLMNLPHNATIYDIHGQNFCLTNSLTIDPEEEEVRQLIFFPDGHLRYDWQYEGAVLL